MHGESERLSRTGDRRGARKPVEHPDALFDGRVHAVHVEEGVRMLNRLARAAAITCSGQPLAFPMHLPDDPLRAYLGEYGAMPLADGIRETYEAFRSLLRRGLLSAPEAA